LCGPRAPAPGDFSRGCRPAYADNDPLDHCPGASALLDLNSGNCLNDKVSLVPAEAGRNAEVWLGAVVLLARRQSRQPGCFASGESQGINRRGKFTFPCGCSRAFLGQKPSNYPLPQRTRRSLFAYLKSVISPVAGPGQSPPWRRTNRR